MNHQKAVPLAPLVVFDGQDGSGKDTQFSLLQQHFLREGVKAGFSREPGGTPFAETLREIIKSDEGMSSDRFTQFLMFWAARNELAKQFLVPTLDSGIPVFLNRGDSSTYAYQIHAQNAPELEDDFWRMRALVFGPYAPTAYVIIDVPAEVARARALASDDHLTVFDQARIEFYERVREGFRVFGNKVSKYGAEVFVVDGSQSIKEVHDNVSSIVRDIIFA